MTTKFRPSIIHYASVCDINKILDELIEDIDEKVAQAEQKQMQFREEGYQSQVNEYHGKVIALLQFQNTLLDKQQEVKERYTRN